ncbi:MAG: hypothetical protein JST41_07355, partial [Bacteroidetes bacterium]|nr:hypothetical protein [Bacteroidota bacterium]
NYAGNLFNGTAGNGGVALNNIFASNNGSNVIIAGKKLMDANTAYRGRVRIGFGSLKGTELVPTADPNDDALNTTENVTKDGFFALNLGVGLEKRVGSTRVVGVYGAEFNVGFGNSKTSYEYGDALSTTNVGTRTTEVKHGSSFGVGLNVFAGVEWFAAPKISLSGEYAWGLALQSRGIASTTTENNVANPSSVVSTTVEGNGDPNVADKTSSFSLDTGVSGARIGVNFYFQ